MLESAANSEIELMTLIEVGVFELTLAADLGLIDFLKINGALLFFYYRKDPTAVLLTYFS